MVNKTVRDLVIDDWIEFSAIGLCHFGVNGEILSINGPAFRCLNLDKTFKSIDELLGQNITELIADYKFLFDLIKDKSIIRDFELQLIFKDGTQKWLLHDCVRGHGGEYDTAIHVIFRDISDYKNIQMNLCQSEKYLCSIIDTIQDIVYRIDTEGLVTFISDSIRQYGYEPDELVGKNITEIIHPEDREKAKFKIDERRSGDRRTREFEIRLLTKNKNEIKFEFKESAITSIPSFEISAEGLYDIDQDGRKKYIGTQGVARDISKRKSVEYAKLMLEEKCSTVLQTLYDGYYEITIDGTILFVNNALAQMLGYNSADIIGKNFINFFPSGSEKEYECITSGIEKIENNHINKLWSLITSSGRIKNFEGSISQIKDSSNHLIGLRGILRDITNKTKIEQELLRARKLEAIGILAGGIAHDYNNALTAIIGNISLAKMEAGENNPDLIEILNDAETASLKAKDLTQRLSGFAKGGRPIKKIISIIPVLKESAENAIYGYAGNYILKQADDIWNVDGDEIQIGQVFDHILKNAREAMPDGGTIFLNIENVVVDIEKSHHEITLQPGKYVLVTVKDSGCGIESEDIYKIFDPYFTTKDMSSGMGLAISYAIIKRHRGYIDVKVIMGEGAEFLIYFPAVFEKAV